ncbi:hypothetical protein Desdi_2278 [Desulfitobacterium dichloroeliminans LMG P-21439]|uniref:Uncharacterized protein n=1 Tax=Desulfitobacterium dichloroeliminans (strain LMG P-21439 / DCA1) TaxID=871963 RepID=L0F9T7_DESDL|nr:hypothetical protein [Desulfitobacterium dichloroeliminans]AGA69708.1 hypothetical protein Desdi_2278 [Desulfitobacterium dichloroeliminans LMG P-21439]
MEDDPLPAPINYYVFIERMEQRKLKQCVAIVVCLFIGLALLLCPYVVFEDSQSGHAILKLNSSINQAPRAFFFGALAVLPQKATLDSAPLSLVSQIDRGTIDGLAQNLKYWLVMVWFGSTYV